MKFYSHRGDSEDMPRFLRKFPKRRSRNVVSNASVVEIRMQSPQGVPLKETMCICNIWVLVCLFKNKIKAASALATITHILSQNAEAERILSEQPTPAASNTHPLFGWEDWRRREKSPVSQQQSRSWLGTSCLQVSWSFHTTSSCHSMQPSHTASVEWGPDLQQAPYLQVALKIPGHQLLCPSWVKLTGLNWSLASSGDCVGEWNSSSQTSAGTSTQEGW